jgi:hypothetical protein
VATGVLHTGLKSGNLRAARPAAGHYQTPNICAVLLRSAGKRYLNLNSNRKMKTASSKVLKAGFLPLVALFQNGSGRCQIAQHEVQDAAVLEVVDLIQRIDTAQQRHLERRKTTFIQSWRHAESRQSRLSESTKTHEP